MWFLPNASGNPPGAFRLVLSLCLACLILPLTACRPAAPRAELTIINGKEPESLDPAILTGQPDGRVALAMFEGLTRFNAVTAEAEPGLAYAWEISPDLLTYTFHLRTNLVWSTGEPLRADDVLYSWIRILIPEVASDYSGNLFYIRNAEAFNLGKIKDPNEVGIHAPDPFTVVVQLADPTPFFLDLCAFHPQLVVPRQAIEKYGDRWLKVRPLPVSGAFELLDWRLEDRIRLRRNPRYWDAANTHVETVDVLPINNPATALNLFLTREVDIVWDKNLVPTELLDVLRLRPDFHVYDFLASQFIRYNVTRKPFSDVRVRHALSMVIDRQRLVTRVTKGGERPSTHITPLGIPGYQPPEGLPYDPEGARKLLAEAGFPNGAGFPRFNYLFNSQRDNENIAIELQAMWKKELNINVELRAMEWKTYLRAQSDLDFDLSRSSWVGDYTDPNTFLDMFMSDNPNNRCGWRNAEYDALMRKANGTANVAERERLLQKAETILVKTEGPIAPLYIMVGFNLFDTNRVQGLFNNLRDEHPLRTLRKVSTPRTD